MNQAAFKDENDMVLGLRLSDERAFASIFKKYWHQLYSLAFAKLRSSEAAEEIVQDLMIALWEKRSTLLINNLSHYLNVSLKNRCIDYVRRNITKEKYWQHYQSAFLPLNFTEEQVEFNELEKEIEKGIADLPEQSRNIFKIKQATGLSNFEIGNRVKLSEKSVEYHISKALRHLRVYLKDYLVHFYLLLSIYF